MSTSGDPSHDTMGTFVNELKVWLNSAYDYASAELPEGWNDADHYRQKGASGPDYECGVIDALTFVIDRLTTLSPIRTNVVGDPS